MIEYIRLENPDHRALVKASEALQEGGLVALPTDTNWVVICDPSSKRGMSGLYKIRKESSHKHFSLLCDSISRATELAHISDLAFRLIHKKIPGHYTFIFEAKKSITKYLQASKRDKEIGIRFPPSTLVNELIRIHEGVLLSANVTHEMLGIEDLSLEIYGHMIEECLGHQIPMILDPSEYDFAGSSSIVSFLNNTVEVVREGAGDVSPFI